MGRSRLQTMLLQVLLATLPTTTVFALPAQSLQQDTPKISASDSMDTPGPAKSATPPVTAAQPDPRPRGVLLREGSYLSRVQGQILRDATTGWWRFEMAEEVPGKPVPPLILLPNKILDEIQDAVEAAPQGATRFEISGQIFVYRGRNFLLATHAPQLLELTVPDPADDPTQDSRVAEIMRDLARDVGPLRRSPGAASNVDDSTTATGQREGWTIVARRGTLTRTEIGAWLFVLDADASGQADPPMVVMPCLMLENLSAYSEQVGRVAPLQLSGQVYQYGGRRYIRPTVFRIPSDTSRIRP